MLAPAGVGGIATYARNVVNAWNHPDFRMQLRLVPRNTLCGWFRYPFVLLGFMFALMSKSTKLVHVNLASKGSPIRKLPFAVLCKLFGKPFIVHFHSGAIHEDFESADVSNLWKRITGFLLSMSSASLFINPVQQDYFVKKGLAEEHRSAFLPNHVSIPESNDIPKKSIDFAFVGRFSAEKGAREFYAALSQMQTTKRIKVAVVGVNLLAGSDYRTPVLSGLIDIEFHGEVSNDKVMEIISRSRVVVLPSYTENYPMVILEAFSLGVPAIATDVGAVPLIVSHGKTGILIPPRSVSELERAMNFYVDNPTIAQSHGANAREFAQKNLDLSAYSQRYIDALESFRVLRG
jgi:glycosyltransferase involved in cell wall biosynthesis